MRKRFSSFDGHGVYIEVACLVEFCRRRAAASSGRGSSTVGPVVASIADLLHC